jgi:hypothetical protein
MNKEFWETICIIAMAILFIVVVAFGIYHFPRCAPDEVYTRGVFGPVCVKGHH